MAQDIDVRSLAEDFVAARYVDAGTHDRLLRYDGKFFYKYAGAGYVKTTADALRDELLDWLAVARGLAPTKVRDEVWEHVRALLRQGTPTPPDQPPEDHAVPNWWINPETPTEKSRNWLALPNGVLFLDPIADGEAPVLVPSSPRWFSEALCATPWDPEATCPQWIHHLAEWLPDPSQRELLQEFAGYCLWPNNKFQKGLFLEGAGANGKSTFLETIRHVIGRRNCASVKLEQFTTNFNALLLGKMVNIAPETKHGAQLALGQLKEFMDGNEMRYEKKFMDAFEATSRTKLMVAWNERPIVNDNSNSFYRRMLLVDFPVSFEGREDADLPERLKAEAPGILNWMLEGLGNLLRRGAFPATAKAHVEAFKAEAQFLSTWIRSNLEVCPGAAAPKAEVQRAYEMAAEDAGAEAAKDAVFAKTLYRVFKTAKSARLGAARIPHFVGLRLKEQPNE